MIFSFIIFIFLLSFWEIYSLSKNKLKKEMVVYIIIGFITLSFGILYFLNPYEYSFAKTILDYIDPNYSK